MKNFDTAVYYGTEAHERVGLSIMMLGQFAGNTTLSDVVFMEPPVDMGHVAFGKAMCYVEFQFSNPPKTSDETIGVLWAPHLFCIAKPWFNENNYQGAITFMMNVVAWNLRDRRDDSTTDLTSQSGTTQAIEAVNGLRKRLSGLLVLTDMRSESFAGKWALHQWNVSGKVHALQGQFVDGEFLDTYRYQNLAPAPVCYRIFARMGKRALFQHNRIDFLDSSEEVLGCQVPSDDSVQAVEVNQTERQRHSQVLQELPRECMVCLHRSPSFVFQACGHHGVCNFCRKWMCKQQYNKNKSDGCKVTPAVLTMDKAAKMALSCPYCRRSSKTMHETKYSGSVFHV